MYLWFGHPFRYLFRDDGFLLKFRNKLVHTFWASFFLMIYLGLDFDRYLQMGKQKIVTTELFRIWLWVFPKLVPLTGLVKLQSPHAFWILIKTPSISQMHRHCSLSCLTCSHKLFYTVTLQPNAYFDMGNKNIINHFFAVHIQSNRWQPFLIDNIFQAIRCKERSEFT